MSAPNVYTSEPSVMRKVVDWLWGALFFVVCVATAAYMGAAELASLIMESLHVIIRVIVGFFIFGAVGTLALLNYFKPEALLPMAIKLTTAIVVSIALVTYADSESHIAISTAFVISSFYVGWRVVKLPVDLIGAIIRAFKSTPNSTQNTTGDPFYDPR